MASCNFLDKLPQEGTSCTAAGESLTVASASVQCPSNSGGGNTRHSNPCVSTSTKSRGGSTGSRSKLRPIKSKNVEELDLEMSEVQTEMDSEAGLRTDSFRLAPINKKFWRDKKPPRINADSVSSSDDDLGESGNAKSRSDIPRKELLTKKRETATFKAGKTVEELAQAACINRQSLGLQNGAECPAAAVTKQVMDDVSIICNVAARSRNLKGTYQRALKDAGESIKTLVGILHERSSSAEVEILQRENARLQKGMEELKMEMTELRKEILHSKNSAHSFTPPPPANKQSSLSSELSSKEVTQKELIGLIRHEVGTMLDERFDSLEKRLLPEKRTRPAIATDRFNTEKNQKSVANPQRERENLNRQGENKITNSGTRTDEPGRRKKKSKSDNRKTAANNDRVAEKQVIVQNPSQLLSPSAENEWTTVSRKGKKKKTASGKVKIRPPRSTAVVITLQPEAEAQGMTYAKVIAEAKHKIDLLSCGITNVRFKKAATGGRILQVPGATSGEKADSLAEKLKAVLGDRVAKITRPTKCASLRILGLDDSVSTDEVITAIAEQGSCSVESVKTSEIRRSLRGTGSVLVKCPVDAAKKLCDDGRLKIGWISATVKLLPPRPTRCYRCLNTGHVRAQCVADTDRSEECYQCGERGHKAFECSATPKCSICTAAGKPSNHKMGSKTCAPPKPKRSGNLNKAEPVVKQNSPATVRIEEEIATE